MLPARVCSPADANAGRAQGGGKFVSGSSPRLTNVTIIGNSGFFAGALYTEVCASMVTCSLAHATDFLCLSLAPLC